LEAKLSKAKQNKETNMKKGQGNKIIACWRKQRDIFNYEKHSFFTLQL